MKAALRFLCIAVALNCSDIATAALYTFSKAYSGNAIPGVALNDNGLVALITGSYGSLVPHTLLTTDGHSSTTIYTYSTNYNNYQFLSLNNNGVVAFCGEQLGGSGNSYSAVYASSGTTISTIAALTGYGGSFLTVSGPTLSINDSGMVAFSAKMPGDSNYHIFCGDGTAASSRLNSVSNAALPAINNAGTVVYTNYTNFPWAVESQTAAQRLVFPDTTYFFPDINNLDVAAYFTTVNGVQKVAIGDGVAPTTYIDGSLYHSLTDGYSVGGTNASCAINDQGLVVFGAAVSPSIMGIFTGPSPTADKVIEAGDALGGETVSYLSFCRGGLNNRGQIAFWAQLSDGTQGVWVATPVPEPGGAALLAVVAVSVLAYGCRRRARRESGSGKSG